MSLPTAIVEHELPGRVRLRVPSKRRDTEWFRSVIQHLANDPNVHEASANPETGGILLRHAGPVDQIALLAPDNGIVDVHRLVRRATPAARPEVLPSGDASLLDAAAIGLTGLGVYQLSQGRILGNAVEHFWSAYGASRTLERPGLAMTFVALGLCQLARGQLLGPAVSLFFYAGLARSMAQADGASARAEDASQAAPAETTDLAG
jgi:hypothetical protein